MNPHYTDPLVTLYLGDCLDVMRELPDASVDSVVTDPPYGLEFMGKSWDRLIGPTGGASVQDVSIPGTGFKKLPNYRGSPNPTCQNCKGMLRGQDRPGFTRCRCDNPAFPNMILKQSKLMQAWHEQWATEAFRVLKPGGYLLAFGGTRTYHRLASAIEDAGFEIRDTLMWIYASGFPKSLDVSKALDKVAHVNDETRYRIQLVAEVIRTHREAKGMERAEVSRAVVGSPSGACWNWEHHQLPSVEMWPAIKRVLDIPDEFDGLIQGTREMFIGAEREVLGQTKRGPHHAGGSSLQISAVGAPGTQNITAPATDLARKWEGWGTALKPAHEPIVMARKPLVGTVAANVTRYGTGALNIDGTRIGTADGHGGGKTASESGWFGDEPYEKGSGFVESTKGRWPSNVLLSDPELFDEPNPWVVGSGATTNGAVSNGKRTGNGYHENFGPMEQAPSYADNGGYSRFFAIPRTEWKHAEWCAFTRDLTAATTMEEAKAAARGQCDCGFDRAEDGLTDYPSAFLIPKADRSERNRGLTERSSHPTVKPIDLMRHLVRLVTPPGGVTLDPFAGSGTTGLAASEEGFRCILIEREPEYAEIIVGRLMATPMGLGLQTEVVAKPRKVSVNKSTERPPSRNKGWSGGWSWDDKPDETEGPSRHSPKGGSETPGDESRQAQTTNGHVPSDFSEEPAA